MVKSYQVRYGSPIEAGTAVSVTVGAEAIAKPIDGSWEAEVVGIGYKVIAKTYKEALDECLEKFKKDIGERIINGDKLPRGLKFDFKVFLFEDE